jgi:hypothetical protein
MELKVSETTPLAAVKPPVQKERSPSGDFEFALNRLNKEGLAERLGGLLKNITEQGKKIADHMDIGDLKRYRNLVSDFINEVVTNAHQYSRENFLDRRGRHRVYNIIKLVDKDLDDLAQELLKQEKNHLAILDKIGDIEGMLLDLLI